MYLITFSGLDGCGKSTHVDATLDYLARCGLTARPLLTVNISATGVLLFLRRTLQRMGSSAMDQKTATSPSGARIRVYSKGRSFDEDRRRPVVVLKRWLIYPFDAMALRLTLAWLSLRGVDAVVCDRYTFDKLVNLPTVDSPLSSVVRRLAPTPDLALFLDVSPDQAVERREEHDRSYYETKYAGYRKQIDLSWGLEALKPTSIEETQTRIEERLRGLSLSPQEATPEGR
jgi:thymidylate kinase